ncbi:replication protein O [Marinobacter adhaerens]|uniref:Replication protein O n=1 Tax=Marinobacter adhaerens TaxID=1033846 RepID=A0A851HTD1_9GAMM|nr:replication protein O [Marinobacter adhaerens]NWN92273.1 replication protein O [Marinobacter adhaerens]
MSTIELMSRPIAFHRAYVDLGVGITGALMLSQCVYWRTRTSNSDGWFYKSQTEWQQETGMGRREQETARKRLVQAGFLEEDRRGVPAKLYFRVNTDALEAALEGLSSRMAESANQECTDKPSSMAESAKQECTKAPNSGGGKRQSITEISTETTSEITAERTSEPNRPDSIEPTSNESDQNGQEPDRPGAAIQSGKHWGTVEDLQLADGMWGDLVNQLGDDSPRQPNMAAWANSVRLMRERDGRKIVHINALWHWCRQHSFWAANIQSPAKLREKWSQLAMQRNREREPGQSNDIESHNREVGMSWAQRRSGQAGEVIQHER